MKTAEEVLDEFCGSLPAWTYNRKQAVLKAMEYYRNQPTTRVNLNANELAALHDILVDIFDLDLIGEELFSYYERLPDDIKADGIRWGLNDSVVRDSIYVFFENKKNNGEG